jgi:hypothetical protein
VAARYAHLSTPILGRVFSGESPDATIESKPQPQRNHMCRYIKIWTESDGPPAARTFTIFRVDHIARVERTDENKTLIMLFGYSDEIYDIDANDVEAAINNPKNYTVELYERNAKPKEIV